MRSRLLDAGGVSGWGGGKVEGGRRRDKEEGRDTQSSVGIKLLYHYNR